MSVTSGAPGAPRSLGWLPDPLKRPGEKPDFDAEELLGLDPAPPSADNRNLIAGVLDQGNLGSCVANAGFQAIRANHIKQGVALDQARLGSRLFGYYVSRAYHHDTGRDTGTHLRTFFQALNKFGWPPEEVWPYEDVFKNFKRMPPTKAFMAAFDQKSPTTYRRIYDTGSERVDAVKRALAKGLLVVFGTDVGVPFLNLKDDHQPLPPPIDDTIAGGHAMCIVGYDGDNFDVVNSWGTGWGSSGWCRFSADYLTWGSTRDIWIVEHAPRYSA